MPQEDSRRLIRKVQLAVRRFRCSPKTLHQLEDRIVTCHGHARVLPVWLLEGRPGGAVTFIGRVELARLSSETYGLLCIGNLYNTYSMLSSGKTYTDGALLD